MRVSARIIIRPWTDPVSSLHCRFWWDPHPALIGLIVKNGVHDASASLCRRRTDGFCPSADTHTQLDRVAECINSVSCRPVDQNASPSRPIFVAQLVVARLVCRSDDWWPHVEEQLNSLLSEHCGGALQLGTATYYPERFTFCLLWSCLVSKIRS